MTMSDAPIPNNPTTSPDKEAKKLEGLAQNAYEKNTAAANTALQNEVAAIYNNPAEFQKGYLTALQGCLDNDRKNNKSLPDIEIGGHLPGGMSQMTDFLDIAV